MAADAWAGSPAKPGVCLTTLGPGALNLTTGCRLCAARRDADGDDHRPEGYPVLASSAVSRSSDVVGVMRPLTKLARPDRPRQTLIPTMVREAFRVGAGRAARGPAAYRAAGGYRRGDGRRPRLWVPAHPVEISLASEAAASIARHGSSWAQSARW